MIDREAWFERHSKKMAALHNQIAQRRAKLAATAHLTRPDGFADLNVVIREAAKYFHPNPPESVKRSIMRRQEAVFRRFPRHDAHVRLYLSSFTPTERQLYTCRRCKDVIRHLDRPRDAAGRPKLICAPCVADFHDPEARERREAERRRNYKRIQRAITASLRPHDAHIKAWKAQAKRAKAEPLHNAHVREFKSDAARYARWRVQHDAAYRLNTRLRVQIRKALKGQKGGRSWESFVGYTLEDLAKHLARMLPKRKTLADCLRDGWHIDHITPKSTYDLSKPDELRAAWCLSNLRLIPPKENLSKGAKRVVLI